MTARTSGILRAAIQIANTAQPLATTSVAVGIRMSVVFMLSAGVMLSSAAQEAAESNPPHTELESFDWDFGRSTDRNFDDWPDGWRRWEGPRYPSYVKVSIAARHPDREQDFLKLDRNVVRFWPTLRKQVPSLPLLPPSIADAAVDRYLRIDLDGGLAKVQSQAVATSRLYQYRFRCDVMTERLHHDTVRAELVFVDEQGNDIAVHPTAAVSGTSPWTQLQIPRVRPPDDAAKMMVRLVIDGAEDGLEDIRGTIGFDNLRIEQFPQLQVLTDDELGVYAYAHPITVTAKVMGLPVGASRIRFRLFDSEDRELDSSLAVVDPPQPIPRDPAQRSDVARDAEVTWTLPRISPGFYRVTAALDGNLENTLATGTTVAVIDTLVGGPPHGSFGWTMPDGSQGIQSRTFANWLSQLGVAWVKYPCWLPPEDTVAAEQLADLFGQLQDAGVQTVGMLDVPPDDQVPMYGLRGRKDIVAAQLFRDQQVWQPLLEPVMTRLTLKVRTWQIGADRDDSFLGRPRLRESITNIATGLQGYGQPIDVAISWPWLEPQLPPGESSWQAICRSSVPPLNAQELDAFLRLNANHARGEGPRTWLLLDPIAASEYDRDTRIRDLVLRMATVRNHRVQAAFVSNPRDTEHGLLRHDGRPGELLLPWRTTARLIGNLRQVGSLQLRSGAENAVFAGSDRAVMMVWSAEPIEELMYLGDNVQAVDVWGKISFLRTEQVDGRAVQRIRIGPLPTFIIGADPTLLAFRMSVEIDRQQLDSLLGQTQKLAVLYANPTRDSMVGELLIHQPETWTIENPKREWEILGRHSASEDFKVVLGNSATIGEYEIGIDFTVETNPPQRITVYRKINVGPEGLDLKLTARLTPRGDLRARMEMTNQSARTQSYDCMVFMPPRQYLRRFVTIKPGETVRRDFYWPDGAELLGGKMLLRAVEQDGRRVLNYAVEEVR